MLSHFSDNQDGPGGPLQDENRLPVCIIAIVPLFARDRRDSLCVPFTCDCFYIKKYILSYTLYSLTNELQYLLFSDLAR